MKNKGYGDAIVSEGSFMMNVTKWISIVAVSVSWCAGVAMSQQVPLAGKTVEDIKRLESQVVEVVKNAQPATVSLTSQFTGAWGSGVVVSEDGLILSAAHVVSGAKKMEVIFPDGTEAEAKVLGCNLTKDTAMLQIVEKGSYPYVKPGDSDQLVVGDYLIAMGHAGGYDPLRKPPVRFGRLVTRGLSGFFSSDCTLIGGDSGGPVFDIQGQLVGINSSIGEDKKANNHAGISGVRADWQRLLRGENWGRLGASPLADKDSPVLGLLLAGNTRLGVLVGAVTEGGAAAAAGIVEGDIVSEVEGTRIRSVEQLLIEVNRYRPGQEVELSIMRRDGIMKTMVKLMRRGDLQK